jgi:hypothetical protein
MAQEMMVEAAFWGQNQGSYTRAEEILQDKLGIPITDSLIQQVTEYVGQRVFTADEERAAEVERKYTAGTLEIPPKPRRKGVFYVMVDGAAVNMRVKDGVGSAWRENKLGCCFPEGNLRGYAARWRIPART